MTEKTVFGATIPLISTQTAEVDTVCFHLFPTLLHSGKTYVVKLRSFMSMKGISIPTRRQSNDLSICSFELATFEYLRRAVLFSCLFTLLLLFKLCKETNLVLSSFPILQYTSIPDIPNLGCIGRKDAMAARLKKKAELMKKKSQPLKFSDSLKGELEKKKERSQLTPEERRNALCEELGRGC